MFNKGTTLVQDVDDGQVVQVWGMGRCGGTLLFPINFAVNFKMNYVYF